MTVLPTSPPDGHFRLNWHQDREIYDTDHFLIVNIGGYGSGKTQSLPFMMRDRSTWDTGQRHGFFANTITQMNEGILPDLYDWLDKMGIEYVFGSRPPAEWVQMWRDHGIPFPNRGPRSPHTLILKSGLHVVCGGVANNAYRRFKGFRFGSIWGEEVTEWPDAEPIRFLLPRVRCGDFGSGKCQALHRHQMFLHGNPPDPRQPHWIRDWIKDLAAEERENLAKGDPPFFMYIRSSTYDNVENVGTEYIDRLRKGLDRETAEAMINGSLEQVSSATTMNHWSKKNVLKQEYDQSRPIYVAMDFNVRPAASTLAHELREHEVPSDHQDAHLVYHGVWGEFSNNVGMTAVQHAEALVHGLRDKGGHWPREFKGLKNHQAPIYMYGDASGHQRRVEADDLRSAWQQVNQVMEKYLGNRYHFDVPRVNPSEYDSVTLLNSKMESDDGEVTYFVAPWCVDLIKDCEQVVPMANGKSLIDKRKDGGRTHWLDPERYKVARRYPGTMKNNLKQLRRMIVNQTSALKQLPPVLGSK